MDMSFVPAVAVIWKDRDRDGTRFTLYISSHHITPEKRQVLRAQLDVTCGADRDVLEYAATFRLVQFRPRLPTGTQRFIHWRIALLSGVP